MPEFPRTAPVTVVAKLNSGAMEITAEPRESAAVDIQPYDNHSASREAAERTTVELKGDTLTIAAPEGNWLGRSSGSILVTVRVPLDSSLRLKAASADVTCRGRLAAFTAHTASGDLDVEHVTGTAHARSASGDVTAGRIDGEFEVTGGSCGVVARHVGGAVDVSVASGTVEIGEAEAGVKAKTSSGDVRIGAARRGVVKVNTTSGDVSVGVQRGTGVWFDVSTVSGRTHNDLNMGAGDETGHDLGLQIRTVSGDVDIHRAPTPSTQPA
jgi:DUF4097 and DUF4098 domain-containing protein YvlB